MLDMVQRGLVADPVASSTVTGKSIYLYTSPGSPRLLTILLDHLQYVFRLFSAFTQLFAISYIRHLTLTLYIALWRSLSDK